MNDVALSVIVLSAVILLAGCTEREDAPPHHHARVDDGVARTAGDMTPTPTPGFEPGLPASRRATVAMSEAARDDETPLAAPVDSRASTVEPEGLQTFTEEEDYDGDGIADTRTIRRFKYDVAGRTCRLVTERDFDADGTIDARTTNTSSYGAVGACGT